MVIETTMKQTKIVSVTAQIDLTKMYKKRDRLVVLISGRAVQFVVDDFIAYEAMHTRGMLTAHTAKYSLKATFTAREQTLDVYEKISH